MPVRIAAGLARLGRRRKVGIALEPVFDDVVEELLRPQQARVGLPGDQSLLQSQFRRNDLGIELVALVLSCGHDVSKGFSEDFPG